MVKVGDQVTLTKWPNRGTQVIVKEIIYNNDEGRNYLRVVSDAPHPNDEGFHITLDKITESRSILGVELKYGQEITVQIKTLDKLTKEQWVENEKKHLTKKGSYYKFTKEKLKYCGQVIKAKVIENPMGKLAVRETTHPKHKFNFDESMIAAVIVNNDFKAFEKSFSGLFVRGNKEGDLTFYVKDENGNESEYSLDRAETKDFIKELFKFHGWSDNDV